MTTIDQRILIPTPPEVVWDYISNIKNNTQWQAGCNSVTFLTSKLQGPGARWRQTSDRGDEQVIEVTAWYDGLGYQYTYIDGMPFRESMGRIRLQEIPEGTVVQWTITYEMAGMFGNVRAALGLNSRLDNMMVVSLKTLWKQVNESGSARKYREAKSLIREAPDAEARANYRPRHTPVVDLRAEGADSGRRGVVPTTAPAIVEPPVSDEDTRPRRPVTPPPAAPVQPRQTIDELVAETEEPEFLRHIPDDQPPVTGEDTQQVMTGADNDERFKPPASLAQHAVAELETEEKPEQPTADNARRTPAREIPAAPVGSAPVQEDEISVADETGSRGEPEVWTETEPEPPNVAAKADSAPPAAVSTHTAAEPTREQRPVGSATGPLRPMDDISSMDTARLSIWEIFGVPRPSEIDQSPSAPEIETTAAPAVQDVEETSVDIAPLEVAEHAITVEPLAAQTEPPGTHPSTATLPGGHIGLRVRMRRRRARLRRPT